MIRVTKLGTVNKPLIPLNVRWAGACPKCTAEIECDSTDVISGWGMLEPIKAFYVCACPTPRCGGTIDVVQIKEG